MHPEEGTEAPRADRINSSRGIGHGWKREKALRAEEESDRFVPPTVASRPLSAAYVQMRRKEATLVRTQQVARARVANAYTPRAISWSNGPRAAPPSS